MQSGCEAHSALSHMLRKRLERNCIWLEVRLPGWVLSGSHVVLHGTKQPNFSKCGLGGLDLLSHEGLILKSDSKGKDVLSITPPGKTVLLNQEMRALRTMFFLSPGLGTLLGLDSLCNWNKRGPFACVPVEEEIRQVCSKDSKDLFQGVACPGDTEELML